MTASSLLITGFGVSYPPHLTATEDLDKLAHKWYPSSPALDKVLAINRRTGIKARSIVCPLVDLPCPSSVRESSEIFNREGIPLAKSAAQAALAEAALSAADVTHLVATTCTSASHPGFDCVLSQELNLRPTIERVLLGGVGCAGGLAALRLAASLCQAAAWRGEPAHVLVVACEITTTMGRDELRRIAAEQQVRIGITLFGDGAAALVLSLDRPSANGIYELVNWTHMMVADTLGDLRFDPEGTGFTPTLSHRVPALTSKCVPQIFSTLLSSSAAAADASATLATPRSDFRPREFDWAVHPGGAAILTAVQETMGVGREHLKASWEIYEQHGNMSSVTVLCVLDALRRHPGREEVVSIAFGPGVAAEGALLRRITKSC